MRRESYGRIMKTEKVKVEKPLAPEQVMWSVYMKEVRRTTSGDVLPADTNTYTIADAPEYHKDVTYFHGQLQPATHLWCDVTHASDKCTLKGQRYINKQTINK